MSPRPNVSHIRIPQILQAAIDVFAKKGIATATMDDIALKAGISKATIYLYFKNKEALLDSILPYYYDEIFEPLKEMAEKKEESASDRIRYAISEAAKKLAKMRKSTRVIYDLYSLALRRPKMKKYLRERFRQSSGVIAQWIDQGMRDGEFRPVDSTMMAMLLGANYEGMIIVSLLYEDKVSWQEHAESAVETFLAGISAQNQS